MKVPALAIFLATFGIGSCADETAPITDLYERASAAVSDEEAKLIDFRRDLHRFPEVAGQERRTAAKVEDELRKLGVEVQTEIGGHGVVGMIGSKNE